MSKSNLNKKSRKLVIPPKPKEPDPYECCGRGCDPCIYDYYAKRLARWEKQVKAIKSGKHID